MLKRVLKFCEVLLALLVTSCDAQQWASGGISDSFVRTNGDKFMKDGKPFYFNGFNAYWLMYMAVDPVSRSNVTDAFVQASKYGMNVARTWAFNDGGYRALQKSPGIYDEDVFKGLDFVVAEAKKYGIYLILTFVNNWSDFGGKRQYVKWGSQQDQKLGDIDDFFSNPMVKGFYKNHIKAVTTRVNTITKVAYKDDPIIFAWELMNEPRCTFDQSGNTLQGWIEEMSAYVKSIDSNHLLDIGLEGFYGQSNSDKKALNPHAYTVGADFVSNNRIADVDFTTIHLYPEQWQNGSYDGVPAEEDVEKWLQSHIHDSKLLGKPIVIAEFGKSSKLPGYTVEARDAYFTRIFNNVTACARSGGPCAGTTFWQLIVPGMEHWDDGFGVILEQSPSTATVIQTQSKLVSCLSH